MTGLLPANAITVTWGIRIVHTPNIVVESGQAGGESLGSTTLLADITLPHAGLVLDEIFTIPPLHLFPDAPVPATLADLAAASGLDVAAVISRIRVIQRMGSNLEIAPQELLSLLASKDVLAQPVLLDVREPWEYAICHLAGSLLLSDQDFPALLPSLQQARCVVAICHHGVRSVSAALYLRQHGVAEARSLTGGVDLWATTVAPGMPRY